MWRESKNITKKIILYLLSVEIYSLNERFTSTRLFAVFVVF